MGNYKEGYVNLYLNKDTPFVVIESLVDLMYFPLDYKDKVDYRKERIEKLKATKKHKFFKGEIGRLLVEIDPTLSVFSANELETLDMKAYMVYSYCVDHYITDFSMFEGLYCDDKLTDSFGITAVKNALRKRRFANLYIRVKVNAKQYSSELDDLIYYLTPYLIKNHPNKVGHIQDEDGYLNKDLYLDMDLIKREIASRNYICNGCANYQENFDCPYWKKCFRAYEIGKKSK